MRAHKRIGISYKGKGMLGIYFLRASTPHLVSVASTPPPGRSGPRPSPTTACKGGDNMSCRRTVVQGLHDVTSTVACASEDFVG